MNSVVYWALNRAKEPSTWAGLAGLTVVIDPATRARMAINLGLSSYLLLMLFLRLWARRISAGQRLLMYDRTAMISVSDRTPS